MRWKGTPLSRIQLRQGEWTYSRAFAEAQVRWECRLTLAEWDALLPEDQAEKLKVWQTRNDMRSVEMREQEREASKWDSHGSD